MCGRTACTLCKEDLLKATKQYNNQELPKWVQKYSWQTYKPSFNVGPKQVSPVLMNGKQVTTGANNENVVLFPMKWGLVPSWYKGIPEDFSAHTHNCRFETILKKPAFEKAVKAGQRCVILADGFYEWKRIDKTSKSPFFIYFQNKNGLDMKDRVWEEETFPLTNLGEWMGPRLLTMAGLYDVCESPENGRVYSYSIITLEASKSLQSVHDRMPAVLDGADQVQRWLDSQNVSYQQALETLTPVDCLEMYQVEQLVNYGKNDAKECVLPADVIKMETLKRKQEKQKITNWFSRKENPSEMEAKRLKI